MKLCVGKSQLVGGMTFEYPTTSSSLSSIGELNSCQQPVLQKN